MRTVKAGAKARADAKHKWMAQFQAAFEKSVPNCPIIAPNWETAEYQFSRGWPPEQAALSLSSRRMASVGRTEVAKCWHDKGDFETGPLTPEAVKLTMKAAVDAGLMHGTIYHWEVVKLNFHPVDVEHVMYKWEYLDV